MLSNFKSFAEKSVTYVLKSGRTYTYSRSMYENMHGEDEGDIFMKTISELLIASERYENKHLKEFATKLFKDAKVQDFDMDGFIKNKIIGILNYQKAQYGDVIKHSGKKSDIDLTDKTKIKTGTEDEQKKGAERIQKVVHNSTIKDIVDPKYKVHVTMENPKDLNDNDDDKEKTWLKDEIVGLLNSEKKPYDLNALKALITTKPKKLIDQNEKIGKSGFGKQVFFDFTLPAYHGVVYDEAEKKWKVVITCPNAGGCKSYCYAAKGGYVQFEGSAVSSAQTLNFIMNHPEEFKERFIRECKEESAKLKKSGKQLVVRVHDAGDVFSKDYLNILYSIAKSNPDVLFYAYTKRYPMIRGSKVPENFVFNFSVDTDHEGYYDWFSWKKSDNEIIEELTDKKKKYRKTPEEAEKILEDVHRYHDLLKTGKTKQEAMQEINHDNMLKVHMENGLSKEKAHKEIMDKHVDTEKEKHSQVVPKEVFEGIGKKTDDGYVFTPSEISELKTNLADYFVGKGKPGYPEFKKSLITWNDLENLKEGKPNQYNVMVYAGHGDDAAARRDVLGTYLFIH